ncbi:CD59A glycoprotein-like [Larimichthys crocea]|uniref:CD59A glycoprotein-like n=1 Tax=Larimichthys crocea TaxID=215358 RepID=UPI000F5E79C5|nr:CD59A glycoprotein-like [Larimichthys crocea]
MKLYGVLLLLVTLSAAYGLKCYYCVTSDPKACTSIGTCAPGEDRCATLEMNGVTIKGCQSSDSCSSPIKCCQGDLCNGVIPT